MATWIRLFLATAMLGWIALPAAALDEVQIGELSYLDRQFMQQQRELLADLTARHYGTRFSGDKQRDLGLLQRLLDDELVRGSQTRELQAMGVIMGDLLASELNLHWVIYKDRAGRSRALRYRETDNYLFPITMISRRREVDNDDPVATIYQKAVDTISPALPQQPFQ